MGHARLAHGVLCSTYVIPNLKNSHRCTRVFTDDELQTVLRAVQGDFPPFKTAAPLLNNIAGQINKAVEKREEDEALKTATYVGNGEKEKPMTWPATENTPPNGGLTE